MLPRSKTIYENCSVLDVSGNLLFRAGRKKLDWYLSRNLAHEIDETTIQLTFQNKGNGRSKEPFYLQDMRNICVVCNSSSSLTMHHVVPYQYRQNMPEAIKSHSSFDLLPVCIECHDRYERHASALKKHLAECFDAPFAGIGWIDRPDVGKAAKAAAALLSKNPRIPRTRLDDLGAIVQRVALDRANLFSDDTRQWIEACRRDVSEISANENLLHELCAMEVRVAGPDFRSHGEMVVDAVLRSQKNLPMCPACKEMVDGGIPALVVLWRKHFVEHAHPAHLPDHWVSEYTVCNK
ncbi:hypothetical protein LPJ57_008752 [Coemansia sp. RSA 486]|nr:hypothetical protein LPJ57_008752 [Coemansia sp. RSA 486]